MAFAANRVMARLVTAVTCCDQESSRYALGCIQLRCQFGELTATDGRQIYLHGGWNLPFEDQLLIPGIAYSAAKT